MLKNYRFNRGFSLIELVVVIIVVLILAGGASMHMADAVKKARLARAVKDLNTIQTALETFEQENPEFELNNTLYLSADPAMAAQEGFTAVEGYRDYDLGLRYLVGRTLNQGMRDPWDIPYQLNTQAGMLLSTGSDRKSSSPGVNGPQGLADDRDIIVYYRGPELLLLEVFGGVDAKSRGFFEAGDEIWFRFNKDVRVANLSYGGSTPNPAAADIEISVNLHDWSASFSLSGVDPFSRGGSNGDGRLIKYILTVDDILSGFDVGLFCRISPARIERWRDFNPYYIDNPAAGDLGRPMSVSYPVQIEL